MTNAHAGVRPPKLGALALLAVLFLEPAAGAAEPAPIPWHSVPATATAVARAQQKILLVYYRNATCKTCNRDAERMLAKAAADEVFVRALETFLPLRVADDGTVAHPVITALASRKAPLFALFDHSGTLLTTFEKSKLNWSAVAEELLRFRAARELIVASADLRLSGQPAAADFALGNALLNSFKPEAAAERYVAARDAYGVAGDRESEQLAEISAGYAVFAAGQRSEGRRRVDVVLKNAVSNAVAAEAHLAYGNIWETSQKKPESVPVETSLPSRGRGRRPPTEMRTLMVQDPAAIPNAIESYRKAYALAPPGSTTSELARNALARLDKAPLAAKESTATLRIVPPARQTITGFADFVVEAAGGVETVELYLDGRKVATEKKAPFRFTVDVGSTPRARTLRAVALGPGGAAQGEALLTINDRQDAFVVGIVSPAPASIEGRQKVELDVRVPPDRTLSRVDLSWNGKAVATLDRAPFVASLEVPKGEFGYLRAVGVLDDGTTTETTRLYNAGGLTESVEVGVVTVIATVLDKSGKRLAGLTGDDFLVEEEGRRVAASLRSSDDEPVTIGIAIDSSSSMSGKQLYVIRAAADFIGRALRTQDEAFVVAFDTAPRLVQARTKNAAALQAEIYNLMPAGGTSMFDGVTFALQQFQGIAGKKALLVFTDGREGTSTSSAKECERLARTLGVPVYVIAPPGGERLGHALRPITELTGGALFHAPAEDALPGVFERLIDEMRGQYVLSFTRPAGIRAGTWRTVRVGVPGRDAEVRTIQGYRAN